MAEYDRMQMLKDFDNTKAGVKGLGDLGLSKLPNIFVRPSEEVAEDSKYERGSENEVPVIDLSTINDVISREKIVEKVRDASEKWGFFQVVNHGIPLSVLDGMIEGVRGFNEGDDDEKKKYYSRDVTKTVRFNSSHDLFTSRTASWRDTLSISFNHGSHLLDPQELPLVFRESAIEYSKNVEELGNILLGLLSEALGLKTSMLESMECSKGHRLHCHYYPACPEPKLAMGITKHSDPGFITILLQNQLVSGLQIMHEGRWIDIPPISGGLVVNIGDLLQSLVSNGKLRSVEHRAIANGGGPRISVACFFSGPFLNRNRIYEPIKELINEKNPAVYTEVNLNEYITNYVNIGLDQLSTLDYYKL